MTRAARRRWGRSVAAVLLLAGVFGVYRVSKAPCYVLVGSVTCRVETSAPLVGLSFDDGPTDPGLDAVLPVLERQGVHATFFLVGEAAEARPDLLRRLVAAGHEVGNHSWRHARMIGLTRGAYPAEIARTNAVLQAAGARPALFRAPYGKKLTGLPLAVRDAGMAMVTGDLDEPATKDPRDYARQLVAAARPGSIIVIHPMFGANATARAALPLVLAGLKRRGLRPVPVGELLMLARGRHGRDGRS